MPQPPQSPQQPTGPTISPDELQKKMQLAEKLEDALRWMNLSDAAINELRGSEERTGPGWQRLARAVVLNDYPSMFATSKKGKILAEAVRPAAVEGLRFSRKGSTSLQECAYRYEYFKALYDEEKREILDSDSGMTKQEKYEKVTKNMLAPEKDVQGSLTSDINIIQKERTKDRVEIDTKDSEEEIVASVRNQASEIGMGNHISTAYHARKHFLDLPPEEQKGHPVEAYLKSLEKTLSEGRVSNFNRLDDGKVVHATFERRINEPQDQHLASTPPTKETKEKPKKRSVLRAQLFIRPNTGAVAPTQMKGPELQ